MNDHRWKNKAKLIYAGTRWEHSALAAGVAMDNRLNTIAKGPYGQESASSVFDMAQWLKWFDYHILVQRGLGERAALL